MTEIPGDPRQVDIAEDGSGLDSVAELTRRNVDRILATSTSTQALTSACSCSRRTQRH